MFKNTLLLLSLSFLFSACAERGYKLTINDTTNTIIAQKNIDIDPDKKDTVEANIEEMNQAVQKEQKKKHARLPALKTQEEEVTQNLKEEEEKRVLLIKEQEEREEKAALERKLVKEKKVSEHKVPKEKEAQLFTEKEEKALLALKKEEEKAALERKLVKEKEAQLFTEKEEKALLALKKEEEKAALERKLAKEKSTREAKELEEKKAREAKAIREKEVKPDIVKSQVTLTEPIIFQPINKTYHKFGTSEIHGHVIFLDALGEETNLGRSKVYLLPHSTKLDYWFNHYYLKNKSNKALNKTVVEYLNATTLNLDKNFEFYGVAAGNYYVIIESTYPSRMAKNKKVYIAKKITIQKYKKVMAVFSKKL